MHIRLGLGAAIIPSSAPVTRLHLTYTQKTQPNHIGARKFWRACLPRLKFYNPAVAVTVKQSSEPTTPALLTVYFSKSGENAVAVEGGSKILDSLAPEPLESEKVSTIDVNGRNEMEIWAEFKKLTGAQEVEATEEDLQELERQEQMRRQAEIDRKRVAEIRQAKKNQEAMLKAAREDVQKLRAE